MTILRNLVYAGLAAIALVSAGTQARADERILLFISDVAVQRNGDLIVTETIRVRAEGREIRRGILRDFPTTYTRRDGTRVEVAFDVQSVTRDGVAETFATERLANGVRVRIGSADRFINPGNHDFVIRYRTTRQIGFFPQFDELYWNATGTGWTFAIDVAEARITLPERVPFGQRAYYTGSQGARGTDAAVVEVRPGYIVFRTTRPLAAHQGLTVAASWPKGVIPEPTQAQLAGAWLRDNAHLVVAVIGFALMLVYYAITWFRVGRDPPRGTIIPLFAPPDNMSAAAVRYVRDMASDNRGFTAAIVDCAVRGHIKLSDTDAERVLTLVANGQPLPPAEQSMVSRLFGSRSPTLRLVQDNHGILERARKALEQQLSAAYEKRLFVTNAVWAIWGLVFAVAIMAAIVATAVLTLGAGQGGAIGFGMVFVIPAGIFLAVVLNGGLPEGLFRRIGVFLFGGAFTGIFAVSGFAAAMQSVPSVTLALPAAAPLFLIPLAGWSFSWVKAHTVPGRRVADQIEGFRQYLGVAEEARLEALNPPEKTPELFEKFLPYAIALDVENTWAQRFAGVLAAAAAAGATAAAWYAGNQNYFTDPTGFASDLGSSLSQTIASASTAPGSSGDGSSGSGGGGSSGGGGGGGGGSGW